MKLPVIIQHHPEGYICSIPQEELNEMMKNAKHIDKDGFMNSAFLKATEEIKKSEGIPERWRKPVKKYSGTVYGIESHLTISAEADTEEELLYMLKRKATEMTRGFFKSEAEREWPQPFKIAEIEI